MANQDYSVILIFPMGKNVVKLKCVEINNNSMNILVSVVLSYWVFECNESLLFPWPHTLLKGLWRYGAALARLKFVQNAH